MFRLVSYREEEPAQRKLVEYISPIVTRTILNGMAYMFRSESDYEEFYCSLDGDNFFQGIGQYYKTTDSRAGYDIYRRKLERMKEKLENPEKYYTFDLLEERLLYELITSYAYSVEMGLLDSAGDYSSMQIMLAERLMTEYDIDPEEAARISGEAYNFQEMVLTGDEDENLIFQDDDYLFFFEEGFVKGIHRMVRPKGEERGYGYRYVVQLFEDIGLKAPALLIGTEKNRKTENEMQIRETVARAITVRISKSSSEGKEIVAIIREEENRIDVFARIADTADLLYQFELKLDQVSSDEDIFEALKNNYENIVFE